MANHQNTQEQHWRDFCEKLRWLKNKQQGLSITYDEIARGLSLSRQHLSQFINKPERGLRIDRASILELWDYLTDPKELEKKQDISLKARQKREQLRSEQPLVLDELLKSAGFLPTSQAPEKAPPQIERIKRRLSSFWISDTHVLSHVTDHIIDTILDYGGIKLKNKHLNDDYYSADLAKKWLEGKDPNLDTHRKFVKEITRFENRGKMSFCDEELFELYQSILENEIFQSSEIKMRVTDCQFTTITFSLIDIFENSTLKPLVSELSEKGERNLRWAEQTLDKPDFPEEVKFAPVIQASVRLQVRNSQKSENLTFRYISSSTHITNMLMAFSQGLGNILRLLDMTGFFIRAIGRKTKSLGRISIMLTEKISQETYHGLWVEQNTIVGIVQATAFAVLSWLSARFAGKELDFLYQFCSQSAQIDETLYRSIFDIYNHSYNYGKNKGFFIEENLDKGVIEKTHDLAKEIEQLSQIPGEQTSGFLKTNQEYFENCKVSLDKKNFLARLTLAHAALVKSKSEEAEKHLKILKEDLYSYVGSIQVHRREEEFIPIQVLYQSEEMFFKLLCGDRSFINDKEWRNSFTGKTLENVFQSLRKYVNETNEGIIDLEVYLAASQFSGIWALVEFYTCQKHEREYLEKAVDIFILSAYYSARIGQRARVARCLCHAIRVSCRLGDRKTVKSLIDAVDKILSEVFPPHPGSTAQFELSQGEEALKFGSTKAEFCQAFNYFLLSWDKSKHCNDYVDPKNLGNPFLRTCLDNVYNILQAFRQFKTKNIYQEVPLRGIEEDFSSDSLLNQELLKDFMNAYHLTQEETYESIDKKLKNHVIKGWNSWCLEEKSHPFSERIENGTFLGDCDR
jgi:hypothetical protein